MRNRAKRGIAAVVALTLLAGGCVAPEGRTAAENFGRGVRDLVLAPFRIVAGVLQGIAFLPYTVGVSLAELNRALAEAQAVSLDDAYKATHGVSVKDPRVDQQSGAVAGGGLYGRHRPAAMLEATRAFQRLLVSQGMAPERAQHYALTGVYTHVRSRNHLLVAVVHRQPGMEPFRVVSKHTGIVTTFRPEQMGWREAYERDVNGQVVDEVIDWAGLEYSWLRDDKVVATLMVLAAEAVKSGKRAPDYWQAERRWMGGDSAAVMRESLDKVRSALPS